MFVPGIKNSLHHLNEKDGFEYNYLMTYKTHKSAMMYAEAWASRKTPAKDRNQGDLIPYTVKEWDNE